MLTIAHRGDKLSATENSLKAFRSAIEKKADMIELDVQSTKDGILVVIHDPTIDRTTDGHGYVRDLTLAELQQYKTLEGESIPTLEQVYELCKGKIQVLTEIKTTDIGEKIANLVKKFDNSDEVIVQSFLHGELLEYRQFDTKTRIAVLLDEILLDGETLQRYLEKLQAQGAAIKHSGIHPNIVDALHKNGKFIYAWGMQPSDIEKVAKLGVNGMIGDL